jgi:hypothetical protein
MPQPHRPPSPTSPSQDPTSPTPSPSPSAGGSSRGSSRASGFSVDPGPAFDDGGRPVSAEPELAPAGELHALPEPPALWEEQRVRFLLTAKGSALHALVAVDPDSGEWRYTEADLQAIAPPLTSILNRYDATRAAAAAGDELAVAIGFGGYAARSWRERRHALQVRDELPPEPITGVAAEPGTGPEHDPEWQHTQGAGAYVPDANSDPAPIRGPRR